MKELIEKTTTKAGLKVFACIFNKVYKTGRKVAEGFKESMRIVFDERIKNPWGLYNETRDVAFTHPTIILPLTYFERSRTLMLATNGGQLYADYNTSLGNLSFKFNYGWVNADDKNILTAITYDPTASGHLKSKPSFATQLNYEMMGGTYIFALSYADLSMSYQAKNSGDPYAHQSSFSSPNCAIDSQPSEPLTTAQIVKTIMSMSL
jgi:hypothetical protein